MTQIQIEDDRDDLLAQVVDEFFESVASGDSPDLSDYLRRYPKIADLLKVAIPAMRAAEETTSRSGVEIGTTDQPGERQLGDFRLLRQLGRGGMGIVYEAEQISMKRRVALKVLPLAGLVDELKIQRFHNEVRAVAALDHPHIVSVYTVGEDRGVHYFAMQLIRGRNLAQVIESLRKVHNEREVLTGESVMSQVAMFGPTNDEVADEVCHSTATSLEKSHDDGAELEQLETVARADDSTIRHTTRREYFRSVAALGIQAAKAIQHAHDQGIVHRDVKPANLLLDKSSKLYVTDFGLARMEADAGVTMTGDLIGTLRYMAPEQALAERVVVDHRADIYSLAVTLYELLTLRPAYPAEDRRQLLKQIAVEEPTRLRRIDSAIPSEVETIIHKAMSKDMHERYSSAQELADDLRLFLDNRPIKANPPALPKIIAKWARRNPAIAWASIVTLALVTLAFGISTLLVMKQRDLAIQASRETADQLRIATVTRLAAESRALQDERPILSMLLSIEAIDLCQRAETAVLPTAHEALLNATQRLRKGRPLTDHGTSVSALTLSSDWLITSGEGKAHLWDLTARDPSSSSRVLGTDDEMISFIALSEDGRWLVTGGSKLQRWDLKARNPDVSPLVLAAGDVAITTLGLTPDGRWLVAQSEDGTVRLWDLATANPAASRVLTSQTDLLSQVEVSPDGRWAAAATIQGTEDSTARLWDLHVEDKFASPLLLKGHLDCITSVTISRDSRWLVTRSRDQTARLWDLSSMPTTSSRVLQVGAYGRLLISPDCRWVFTTEDNAPEICRWDLSATDASFSPSVLRGHRDDVRSLAASRDGRWLISGSSDGTARLWDLHAADPSSVAFVLRAHDSGVEAVAIHPSGRWVATADIEGTARIWDLNSADPTSSPFVLRGHDDDTFSKSAISSDGRWVATTIKDCAVQLWDLEAEDALKFSRVLQGPKTIIDSMEMSPDDRWLIVGSRDGTAELWDLTSQDVPSSLIILRAQGSIVERNIADPARTRFAIDSNSRWLAMASADFTVQLWDLQAKGGVALSRVLSGHLSPIESIVISPDGRWLITGAQANKDHTARLWDLTAEDPQASSRVLSGHPDGIFSMAIDGDSRWLVIGGGGNDDGVAQLWDLKAENTATSPRVIPPPGERRGDRGIWRVAISPGAHWLFTGRFDRSAQLWDLNEERPTPYELRGHNGVQSVEISPDGHWLATGCRSNAYLWDLTAPDPTSTARALRGHTKTVWSIRISADSRWLITDASDGTIRRWCLDTDWLLNYAHEVAGRELTEKEREYYGIDGVRPEHVADIQQ